MSSFMSAMDAILVPSLKVLHSMTAILAGGFGFLAQ